MLLIIDLLEFHHDSMVDIRDCKSFWKVLIHDSRQGFSFWDMENLKISEQVLLQEYPLLVLTTAHISKVHILRENLVWGFLIYMGDGSYGYISPVDTCLFPVQAKRQQGLQS
jgi:hypothetical protein